MSGMAPAKALCHSSTFGTFTWLRWCAVRLFFHMRHLITNGKENELPKPEEEPTNNDNCVDVSELLSFLQVP